MPLPLRSLLAAGAAALPLALPTAALATDYCVAPNTTCGGTSVATLHAALDLADGAAGADRIFLGDATYTAPSANGFVYDAPAFPVEIAGAGIGKTTLTGPAGASRVLRLQGGPGSSIHDLAVVLPQSVPVGAFGLVLADPAARIAVTAQPAQTKQHAGILLENGGAVADASVTLSQDVGNVIGIVVAAPSASIARATIAARTGVSVGTGSAAAVDRISATSRGTAVETLGGSVSVTASVLRPVAGGAGLVAGDQPGEPGVASADGVTIVGDGTGGTTGVLAAEFMGSTATLTIENSIIRGVDQSLGRYADAGTAHLTATFTDFDPTAIETDMGAGALSPPAGALEPGGNVDADPRFVDPAGDFHLLPDSPLVDAGDPATGAGFDFDGNQLLVDGDGDGSARRDMGAFERPLPAPAQPPGPGPAPGPGSPPATADVAAPTLSGLRVRAGRTPELRFALDEPATLAVELQRAVPGRRAQGGCRRPSRRNRHLKRCTRHTRVAAVTASLDAGAGAVRLPARPGGQRLRAGRYRVVVIASDAAGNRSARHRAGFRVRR